MLNALISFGMGALCMFVFYSRVLAKRITAEVKAEVIADYEKKLDIARRARQ